MGSTTLTLGRRPLWTFVVVGLVVGLGGTAAQAAPAPVLEVERSRTNELIEMVDADRGAFAGVSFDESTGVATVRHAVTTGMRSVHDRLARLGRLQSRAKASAATSWRVRFTLVRYSSADLEAVLKRLTSDAAWRRLAGRQLTEWYVDVERNVAAVGLTTVAPAVREATRRMFGDMVQLHEAAAAPVASRTDDFQPWHAGSRINSPLGGCTTGFVLEQISNPAFRVMATAGHCGNLNDTITNNGDSIGTMVVREVQPNGLDYAFIGGSTYFPFSYTGTPTSNTGNPIKGTRLPAVGLIICSNGATTGQNCTGKINATNLCLAFTDGITRCHLARAVSTDGSTMSQPGDSGGPIIRFEGQLLISGMHVGGFATTPVFHPVNLLIPSGWRVAIG